MEHIARYAPLVALPIVGLGATALAGLEGPEATGIAVTASVMVYGVQTYMERQRQANEKAKKHQDLAEEMAAAAAAEEEEEEEDLQKQKKRRKKKKLPKANSANSNAQENKRKRNAKSASNRSELGKDAPLTLSGDAALAQNPELAAQHFAAAEETNQNKGKGTGSAAVSTSAGGSKKKRKKKNKKAKETRDTDASEALVQEDPAAEDGWTQISSRRRTKQSSREEKKSDVDPATPVVQEYTVTFPVPTRHHGKIIGEKGATLQLLQLQTETRIEIPKREANSDLITVTGMNIEGVKECKKSIEQLANFGYCSITHPGITSNDVSIPAAKHGGVIGKNGQFIKTIQEETGTNIRMPEKNSPNPNRITIIGNSDGIRQAKEAIRALAREGFSSITHPEWIKDELEFPRESFPTLIGHRGQTIRSIQGDTRTRINIPDKDDENQTVSVVGLPADVQRACVQIMRLLEPPPEPVFEEPPPGDAWGSALPVDDGW